MQYLTEWQSVIPNGSPVYVAGQILGLFCTLWGLIIFFPKKRSHILRLKRANDVLNTVQCGMIGATAGMILNFVLIFRETVFLKRETKKWASHPIWLPVFLCAVAVSPAISIISGKESLPIAVLPAIGSILAVFGYYQSRACVTRYMAFLGNLPWLAYDILVHNLGATISSVLSGIFTLAAILVNKMSARKATENSKETQTRKENAE